MKQTKPDQLFLWDIQGTLLKRAKREHGYCDVIDETLVEVIKSSQDSSDLVCLHVLHTSGNSDAHDTDMMKSLVAATEIKDILFVDGHVHDYQQANHLVEKDFFAKSNVQTYAKVAQIFNVNIQDIALIDDVTSNLRAAQDAGCQIFNAKQFDPTVFSGTPAHNRTPTTLEILKGEMMERVSTSALLEKFLRDRADEKRALKLA